MHTRTINAKSRRNQPLSSHLPLKTAAKLGRNRQAIVVAALIARPTSTFKSLSPEFPTVNSLICMSYRSCLPPDMLVAQKPARRQPCTQPASHQTFKPRNVGGKRGQIMPNSAKHTTSSSESQIIPRIALKRREKHRKTPANVAQENWAVGKLNQGATMQDCFKHHNYDFRILTCSCSCDTQQPSGKQVLT